jgi:erythromycin esterase
MGKGSYNRQSLAAFFLLSMIFLLAFTQAGCKKGEEEEQVDLDWLGSQMVLISSSDPTLNEPALEVIADQIGNARIVGMGEATHGTAEFWDIRQKITRYLVEEKGFTAILHEAGFPNAFPLNSYVITGTGSILDVHERLGSWRYKEMQDLISWMWQYNLSHPDIGNGPALQYFGYDCAFSDWTEAIKLITDFIREVDPAEETNINIRLQEHSREQAVWVRDFIEANALEYTAQSSEKEYSQIRQIAMNLLPSWEVWDRLSKDQPTLEYRDSVNLGNVNWILSQLPADTKVVLWAHNGHVRDGHLLDAGGTHARMLGSRLREQFGNDYYVIATDFYGGQFYAWDECSGHSMTFIKQTAAEPPVHSYTWWFGETGFPIFFLPLRPLDYNIPEASWLLGPKRIRMIGAMYCSGNDRNYYDTLSLPENYDAILFFQQTNPTTRISF